jgi:hypothetical protein
LTQKGFSPAEVMALTEPEAVSLIDILTEKPTTGAEPSKRYIPRRRKRKAK